MVAVIDDGFDLTHGDLSGPGKIVAPWDFTRRGPDPSPEFGPTFPFFDTREQRWVGDWHGTACAGVAIGEANGSGILGAAPQCRLMPVRWGVDLADREVEAWFGHVREQGAWVVSCSWSAAASFFPLSTRQAQAIARCAHEGRNGRGAVICFAASNDGRDVNSPAQGSVNGFAIHPDVIAVAACTSRDERSDYSNFGKEIAVCWMASSISCAIRRPPTWRAPSPTVRPASRRWRACNWSRWTATFPILPISSAPSRTSARASSWTARPAGRPPSSST